MAGNEVKNALEKEYKDGIWFAFSCLAKYSVNPGTKELFTLRGRTSTTIWMTLAGL